MRKGTRSLVISGTLFSALVLALVWTGSMQEVKAADNIDPTGNYALLSVNGNPAPYTLTHEGVSLTIKKGFFTINSDGTCMSNITFVPPNKVEVNNEVKATYTLAGSTLTMKWEQTGGTTTGTVSGNTFTMNNEGMVFVFQKGQAALYREEFKAVPMVIQSASAQDTLEGVWQYTEIIPPAADAQPNPIPPGSLLIFTKKHYSLILIPTPRPELPQQNATDAQKVATWEPFMASAGTYEVNGNTFTAKSSAAKNPSAMAPDGWITSEFKIEGNTLITTPKVRNAGPVNLGSTKLVRVE
jgi:hypothetical protein